MSRPNSTEAMSFSPPELLLPGQRFTGSPESHLGRPGTGPPPAPAPLDPGGAPGGCGAFIGAAANFLERRRRDVTTSL